ncbi:hypothetical protein EMCRGX_G028785 [Ephydatia muelleri]
MEPGVARPVSVVYATLCFLTVLNEASVVAFQSTSSDLEGQDHIYPSTVAPGDTRTPLTLGLMLSFSGDYVTKDAIPGIQIAVDTINAGDILPGYRLQYSLTNSQCDQTVTLTQFFEDIAWSRPSKVGFIGGGCENATIETAKISYFFNLTQLSCDSSTPEAEDRTRFKRYFQILPNDIHFSQAFIQILNTFNWTKLHAINLEYDLFVQTLNLLVSLEQHGPRHNITSVSYSSDPRATNTLDAILSNGQAFVTFKRCMYCTTGLDYGIDTIFVATAHDSAYPSPVVQGSQEPHPLRSSGAGKGSQEPHPLRSSGAGLTRTPPTEFKDGQALTRDHLVSGVHKAITAAGINLRNYSRHSFKDRGCNNSDSSLPIRLAHLDTWGVEKSSLHNTPKSQVQALMTDTMWACSSHETSAPPAPAPWACAPVARPVPLAHLWASRTPGPVPSWHHVALPRTPCGPVPRARGRPWPPAWLGVGLSMTDTMWVCSPHDTDTIPQYTGSRCSDPGVQIKVFRSRCSDPGVQIKVFRSRCSDPGVQIQVFRSRCSDPGVQIQVFRSRCSDPGVQIQVFRSRCSDQGVQIQVFRSRCSDPGVQIYQNTESRIIYLAMYVDDIIPALCEAYHQNKVYPLYVFITLGWYTDGWWDSSTVNCTRHQMEIALNRSLAITLDPQIEDTNMTTSSGLSFNQYRKLYLEGVSRLNLSDAYDGEPCFDVVWSYAIALNKTIQDLRSDPAFNRLAAAASHLPPNSTFYMENFTYANDVILERMYQHLMNASFRWHHGMF